MFWFQNIDGKERTDSQDHRNGNVSGDIRPAREDRNQSHEVIYEDKEKRCQQVRGKLTVLWSHTTLYNVVVHHHNEHLHKSYETARRRTALRMLAIPLGHAQNNDKQ